MLIQPWPICLPRISTYPPSTKTQARPPRELWGKGKKQEVSHRTYYKYTVNTTRLRQTILIRTAEKMKSD
jgi:hypothetical protein